ncbi:MAG: alanine dehydrogenase [Thermodesulfobacteriota bacterium]
MIIGVPTEIKENEYRVSVVPAGVKELTEAGHRVVIEAGAGLGSGITDGEFEEAGAELLESAEEVFAAAELVIKVKEPRPAEYGYLRDGLLLFTFLHLAAEKKLAKALMDSGVTAIAYETVEVEGEGLPILRPMSEVAGRLSVQLGAHHLLKPYGGEGVLLSGVPGVEHGKILIIGAGTVGVNAARVASALGAEVTVIDVDTNKFTYIEDILDGRVKTLMSNSYNIEETVVECDLLIGAVHTPGARTPTLVTKELVSRMKKGSVIVDVAVDQGGCVETIRPTTHSDPVYVVDGVLHYGVTNMPGAVPRTSTFALTNVTTPYLLKLANLGFARAIKEDPSLLSGVNVHKGKITHPAVAEAVGMECDPLPSPNS